MRRVRVIGRQAPGRRSYPYSESSEHTNEISKVRARLIWRRRIRVKLAHFGKKTHADEVTVFAVVLLERA